MIDDLATRSALTVAAFLLLATGLALLGVFRGEALREGADDLTIHLARQLDAIATIDAEATFLGGEGPLSLPSDLAGFRYRVEIRASDVRVISGAVVAVAPLHARVHPFEPDRQEYSARDLEELDASVLIVGPGDDFVVRRTQRSVHAEPTFLTFAYLPR